MIQGENKLTEDKKRLLKQGTKVEFMWYGNNSLVYTGRIEKKNDVLYFCGENNYDGNNLTEIGKSMQYYNPLSSFFFFTHFEILN